MYLTLEEAREEAKKYIGKYDVPPVIIEKKYPDNMGCSSFSFRFLVNEPFDTEWKTDFNGFKSRMVEVLQ